MHIYTRQCDETKTNRPNFVQPRPSMWPLTRNKNILLGRRKRLDERTGRRRSSIVSSIWTKKTWFWSINSSSFYIVIVSGLNSTCVFLQHFFCLLFFQKIKIRIEIKWANEQSVRKSSLRNSSRSSKQRTQLDSSRESPLIESKSKMLQR